MTKARTTHIRLFALALAAGALLVPVAVSPGSIEVNDACANGTCCFEPGSICEEAGSVRFDAVHNPKGCSHVPD
jgi:hypothetical protein